MRRRPSRLIATVTYCVLLAWSLTVVIDVSNEHSIAVLCSSMEETCRDWADGFSQSTGIPVRMVRMSSGDALARLSRTDGLGDFDVWHGGPAETYELARERGLLVAYQPSEADALLPEFRDPRGYWHGVYLGILGFCSNRTVLQRLSVPVPRDWDDLLDPRLKGQISVPHPVSSGTGYTVLWTTRLRTGSLEASLDYLEALDANVLQYTTSGMAPSRVVGRGEVAVAVGFTQHCLERERDGFSDLVVSYPAGGAGYEIGSVALLRGAREPEAARRYIDYAITPAAQSVGGQLPTRSDVSADPRLGQDVPRLRYTALDAAEARAELTAVFLDRVQP